ncbi:MAG: glycosyltransferase family 4 protein [Chthoniobacter sp.]|nr:glycosyltransferase family 4 protein [Chthoniobacter sp.]
MKILIDGHMLKQAHGGVSRVWRETLGRVIAQCPAYEFTLYLTNRARKGAPTSPRVRQIIEWDLPPRALFSAWSQWQARRTRADIFHSTYYTDPLTAARRIVVTVYDFNHERLPGVTGSTHMIEKKRACIQRADALIAISEATKNDLIEFCRVRPELVTVMPLACNELFACTPTLPDEIAAFIAKHRLRPPYWLYVGRRGTYKNFSTLLRAFAAVAGDTGGSLVVAGGRPELETHEIELLIAHRLEDRVVLLPGISDDALRVAYAGAAAFVFPSLAEGFGLPVIEAMGCGCPVIASDIAVFREVAAEAALYFDPHDVTALADAMRRSLEPNVHVPLVAAGRKRAADFSWEKSATILRGVYESLA